MDDMRIAIAERGVFGGTCLNVGCIPSKMLIWPADLAEHAKHGDRYGLTTEFRSADWPAIVQRVFGRIDPIAEGGRQYRHGLPHVDVRQAVPILATALGDRVDAAEDALHDGRPVGTAELGGEAITVAVLGVFRQIGRDRKSTRLNSSHSQQSRMPSSA